MANRVSYESIKCRRRRRKERERQEIKPVSWEEPMRMKGRERERSKRFCWTRHKNDTPPNISSSTQSLTHVVSSSSFLLLISFLISRHQNPASTSFTLFIPFPPLLSLFIPPVETTSSSLPSCHIMWQVWFVYRKKLSTRGTPHVSSKKTGEGGRHEQHEHQKIQRKKHQRLRLKYREENRDRRRRNHKKITHKRQNQRQPKSLLLLLRLLLLFLHRRYQKMSQE